MEAKEIFYKILKEDFAPKLREIGFKGSGQNFRRINGEVINTINVQANKYGGSCAVNLGIHLTFLPLSVDDKMPDIKKIKEIDCEFRLRLAPKNKDDYWWKYGGLLDSPSKTINHLIKTYFTYGESQFEKYNTVDKISSLISIEEIIKKDFIDIFDGITCQRGALVMARIHEHLGNTSIAGKFAQAGLDNLGGAVLLKSAFEKILNP